MASLRLSVLLLLVAGLALAAAQYDTCLDPTKYGDYCNMDCMANCKDGTCAKDGACLNGCVIGHGGPLCDSDCKYNPGQCWCEGVKCRMEGGPDMYPPSSASAQVSTASFSLLGLLALIFAARWAY